MDADTKTTVGSIVGSVGSGLVAIGFLGFFFPPLLAVGAVGAFISAGAKWYTGKYTAGVQ